MCRSRARDPAFWRVLWVQPVCLPVRPRVVNSIRRSGLAASSFCLMAVVGCGGFGSPSAKAGSIFPTQPPSSRSAVSITSTTPVKAAATLAVCRRRQLRVQFEEGGNATGFDFGDVLIRNVTSVRCSVRGRLVFAAYSAAGVSDSHTSVAQPRHPRTYSTGEGGARDRRAQSARLPRRRPHGRRT
jgi:hypothetical protein